MNCPVCNVALTLADRNGVEIDYCPKCRGVWLDRGELDKIIERGATLESKYRREDESHYDDDDYRRSHHPRKRKSFLGDLFDFD